MDEITKMIVIPIFILAAILFFSGFLGFLHSKEISPWQYYHNIKHEDVSVYFTRFSLQDLPRVRVQTFFDWYYLNPEKWKTCDLFACKVGKRAVELYPVVIYPYRDWVKYLSWRRKADKHKAEQLRSEAQNKALKNLLLSMQDDIDKMKLQSQIEIADASKTIGEISLRIK